MDPIYPPIVDGIITFSVFARRSALSVGANGSCPRNPSLKQLVDAAQPPQSPTASKPGPPRRPLLNCHNCFVRVEPESNMVHHISPHSAILTSCTGRSPLPRPPAPPVRTFSIFLTTSMLSLSATCPKMTCFPSRCGVAAVVMKN